MKIYPNKTKTLLLLSAVALVMLFLFYFMFDGQFIWPLPKHDYIVFGGWAVVTIFYFFITIRLSYYKLDKKCLIQKRMTTEFVYEYDRIIYIDENWSRKNKTLLFITDRGDSIYLIMDKKQVLLDEMLKRCKKLIDRESVLIRFPKVKI